MGLTSFGVRTSVFLYGRTNRLVGSPNAERAASLASTPLSAAVKEPTNKM